VGDELRGSTRAAELVKDRRGGARPGAGRKKGGRNSLKKGWDAWVADIQAVTRREFRREKLTELARADAWRYLERIAIPLALKAQPGSLNMGADEGQMALPLVFVDIPQALEDQRGREAEMLGGGVEVLEGEAVRE